MRQAEHDLLVIRAQDGSRKAMEALVAHHHRDLLRFAYSLCRDTALAEDAVQDAWFEIVGRVRRLHDPRAFRGWIFHAVRWRTLDHLRRRKGTDSLSDREICNRQAGCRDEVPDPARDVDLARAIDALAPDDRETLQLFYVAGLTIPEISLVQRIAPGTVKSRLHRARRQLTKFLEGDET